VRGSYEYDGKDMAHICHTHGKYITTHGKHRASNLPPWCTHVNTHGNRGIHMRILDRDMEVGAGHDLTVAQAVKQTTLAAATQASAMASDETADGGAMVIQASSASESCS